MRHTIDTYTGKRFYWDEIVLEGGTNLLTVADGRDGTHLHPHRVPRDLLIELNGPIAPAFSAAAISQGYEDQRNNERKEA